MRKIVAPIAAMTLLVTLVSAAATAQPLQTKSKSAAKEAADRYRRLPSGFGVLELSDEQKEEIYSIRQNYGEQIDELEAELEKLRSEMNDEIEDVLTTTQKKTLADSRKEKAPRASSTSKGTDSKSDEPKSASTSSSRKTSSRKSSSKK
ncbi:MAG: hypothetical protein KDA96_07995 [Planctomycetaceae bacterium]|nr:hypothetical protein [Planctomycetaceae bacterium]